jgi:hypothetical protein
MTVTGADGKQYQEQTTPVIITDSSSNILNLYGSNDITVFEITASVTSFTNSGIILGGGGVVVMVIVMVVQDKMDYIIHLV